MKTITQYREDIKNLMKKATDIDVKATAENRDLTESELALKNEIMDQTDEYSKTVMTLERQERLAKHLEAPAAPETLPRKQAPREPEAKSKDRFSSFGQQLAAVMKAGLPGGTVDPRLFNASASGMNETVPSDGGFLVQQDFTNEIVKGLFETGILASRCRRIPISGNSNGIKINGVDETSRATTRSGGILAYWLSEASEKTASKPKFRRIELDLKKLVGLCYATDELMEDSTALESIIREGFSSEFGFKLDDAILNGTGTGQPRGILQSPCLVSAAKETGQKAATVVTENIVNMYSRRFASQTSNYVWLYNQEIEPQLFTMSLAVGTGGGPIYMPPGGLSDAPYGRLMGLPSIAVEQCAALGTVGDIVLANLKDGYILADKSGITAESSIHVRFVYDEMAYRFVYRVDGDTYRSTPLTPAKGSATQSHFIALATRA